MWFWVFMLVMNLIIPLSLLGFGLLFEKRPPRSINGVFGYRTSMSMKNDDTWNFAHRYCGRLWKRTGILLIVLTLVISPFSAGLDDNGVGYVGGALSVIQIVVLIASIFPTERALKRKFDENGRYRNNDDKNI